MAEPVFRNFQYFCSIFATSRPRLEAVLHRYEVPTCHAHDLLVETVFELIYKGEGVNEPAAWLVSTLRNKCRKHWVGHRRLVFEAVDRTLPGAVTRPES